MVIHSVKTAHEYVINSSFDTVFDEEPEENGACTSALVIFCNER